MTRQPSHESGARTRTAPEGPRGMVWLPGLLVALSMGGTAALEAQAPFMPVSIDEETGRAHLEIPALDEDVLYMNALGTGLGSARTFGLDVGSGGDEAIVRFQRHGPRVIMIRRNVTMVSSSEDPEHRETVGRAFPDAVMASMEVVEGEGAALVVDATDFLLSDLVDVRGTVRGAGFGAIQLERDKSYIDAARTSAFPLNSEVRTVLTFAGDPLHPELRRHSPDNRLVTFEQHHSFMRLPDDPMPGRAFDPRTGNSATVLQDYNESFDGDYRARYTSRWRLEPSDPEAYLRGDLVEPVNPIVLHLDPGTPEPFRTAHREGALWWNEIFEAAGWQNAVQVRDLPEGMDPMDARYSVIQFVHRSAPGPSTGGGRRDPRTGELLVGMPRMDSHRSHTDFNIYMGLMPVYEATGVPPQLTAEEFTMARRRQLSAHEVGHTLGFPHNFIASAQGRSSVMDYPFPLIEADDEGRLDISQAYVNHGGWSDTLSVRYAYTWYPTPEAEAEGLAEIVQEALDRGHLSTSDGDISGSYPEVTRWVTGPTLFDATERALRVRRELLRRFDEHAVRPGEPLSWLNQRFAHVYLHHRYVMEGLVKYVGGMHYSFSLRGDGQTPTQVIAAEEQRRALETVVQVLSPEELGVPEHIPPIIPPTPPGYGEPPGWINPAGVALPPAVGSHATWIESPSGTAFDPVAVARSFAQETVDNLLHRERMARLVFFHARDESLPSLDEVLGTLVDGSWGASGAREGMTGAYRRAAERAVLDGLFTLAIDENAIDAVRDGATLRLEMLGESLAQAEAGGDRGRDAADRAHLRRATGEIERYLTLGEVPELRTGVIGIPLPWP